jgi:chemotaxis signal transduction protein
MAKRLVAGFPPRRPGFDPESGQVGFLVDKVSAVLLLPENEIAPPALIKQEVTDLYMYFTSQHGTQYVYATYGVAR